MSARRLSPAMAAMSAALTACAASNARGETWDFHVIARGAGQHRTARALARRGLAIVSGSHVRPSRDTYALASVSA